MEEPPPFSLLLLLLSSSSLLSVPVRLRSQFLPSSMASFPSPHPSGLLIYRLRSSANPAPAPAPSPPPPPRLFSDVSMMSERRCSPEDDCSSLLSRLGSDSPRPRMKYGGMFCSVEGAFENKTLNFESFSPQTQRRRAAPTRSGGGDAMRGGGGAAREGQMVVFPSGHARENYGKREVQTGFIYFKTSLFDASFD